MRIESVNAPPGHLSYDSVILDATERVFVQLSTPQAIVNSTEGNPSVHRFTSSIQGSRDQLGRDIAINGLISAYSPAEFGLRQVLSRKLGVYVRGAVLDVGAGSMPYRLLILRHADSYHSLDIAVSEGVDFRGDVMAMTEVSSQRYDVVLSSEVLEHVPDPAQAMKEMARVLKSGGHLVLSTPHLSRVHEAPNDFYRFTKYALADLANAADLEVIELVPVGSICSLIGHQISSVTVVPCWRYPIIRWVVFTLTALLVTLPAVLIDKLPALRKLLPLNMVLIARKV